jgi:hypothetical protein
VRGPVIATPGCFFHWPRYAATLLPGAKDQRPLPAVPFIVASLAAGMFALSPYLALRERRPVLKKNARRKAFAAGVTARAIF